MLQKFEGRVKVGRIDCAKTNYCNQAYIQGYPTLRFYKGVTDREPQQVCGHVKYMSDVRETGDR